MMQFAKIQELIASGGLATAIAVTGIRAEQPVSKQTYPYFSYKILSSEVEPAHQNNFRYEASGSDAQRVFSEQTRDVISLTFYGRDAVSVSTLRGHAQAALRWFKSQEGRDFAAERGLSVQMIGTTVQDRTIYTDAYWEPRLGFDILVHGSVTGSEGIEAIQSIEINPSGVPDESQILYEV